MRRVAVLVLVLFTLAACGGDAEPEAAEEEDRVCVVPAEPDESECSAVVHWMRECNNEVECYGGIEYVDGAIGANGALSAHGEFVDDIFSCPDAPIVEDSCAVEMSVEDSCAALVDCLYAEDGRFVSLADGAPRCHYAFNSEGQCDQAFVCAARDDCETDPRSANWLDGQCGWSFDPDNRC